jgi:hypothetical protein
VLKLLRNHVAFSHGTCDSNVGTKSSIEVDASCSKSQGTSHLQENDDRSLRLCLSTGLCTIALFVGRMGIKRAFATDM